MPEPIQPEYQTYTPSGLVDSVDGNTTKPGAMISLANLIPDPETLGLVVPRAAAYALTSFAGFSTPGYVSIQKDIGNLVYGMLSTSINSGKDQPFVYNRSTGTFLTITGITSSNTPTSPSSSGAWTPPTLDQIGSKVVFTHPGFNGANGYFGWLDFSNFSISSLTGNTDSVNNPTFITNLSANPLTSGVTVGMTITGTNIPMGTTVVYVTATTIIISAAATGTTSAVPLTIAGGTSTSPLWASGNTNTNGLPSVPVSVCNFFDRAYYACGAVLYYSDVLNATNMANATNSLTLGGADAIMATCGQPFFTTNSGGIIASLLAFKTAQIWQVTGDLSLNNVSLNKLSDGIGTDSPRSIATTPNGTMFRAVDGIRTCNLDGQIMPPNNDLKIPFLNPLTPSRIAAAYNIGFYRICTSFLMGGVMQFVEYWLDTVRERWFGPHTLTYDCITSGDSTFYVSGPRFTGSLLQSNVIPNEQTDFYVELSSTLLFIYQTVNVPEFRAMPGWTITEASIFLGYDAEQNVSIVVQDPSSNSLGSFTLTTQFLAPAKPTNWLINFISTRDGGGTVGIPDRHNFIITGTCTSNLSLGSLFVHYQYQSDINARAVDNTIPNPLDFGLVSDPIIHYVMDWGSVADPVLASFDFEVIGTTPPGQTPPP